MLAASRVPRSTTARLISPRTDIATPSKPEFGPFIPWDAGNEGLGCSGDESFGAAHGNLQNPLRRCLIIQARLSDGWQVRSRRCMTQYDYDLFVIGGGSG